MRKIQEIAKKYAYLIGLLLIGTLSFGKDIKVACPIIPPLVENKDKGVIINLLKAIDDEYKDGNLNIKVFPFMRVIRNVEVGESDMGIPIAFSSHIDANSIKYIYSSEVVFHNVFGLYTQKDRQEITKDNISNFRVETDNAWINMFSFKIEGNSKIESSLRKLDAGRIDAFIMGIPATDPELKRLNLKTIKRQFFMDVDMKMIFPKTNEGKEMEKKISEILKKLKENGKYKEIMGKLADVKFEEWQM
jgi:ABC-type amino acid transport substrate-binding protein